ncbi:DUF1640 domain-containing protein [Desulfovibrio inopinatus]|uniref:DUF1640 domain-containing protein n=1 Tax=Desulfovibrio inopinatus TaxID=102109 RepID=UPI0004246528|nr:DUF1640 domain-containing protein [Desulfovibrio inopinatus]
MLTYEQSKAIENALGPDNAKPIIEAIQSTDSRVLTSLTNELATKSDLAQVRTEFAGLKTEFAGLKTEFAGLRTEFAELRKDVAQFETKIEARLGAMDAKIEARLGAMDTKMEARFAAMDVRITRIETMLKVLIGLAVLAVGMFSPAATALFSSLK